ncbi:thioredoxin family protein [Dokdonella sp.]|uniref:thioredoxin family protein n=1 Tax=Dokdonella sp. TaxID=2291710 RepID=UPI0035280AA7
MFFRTALFSALAGMTLGASAFASVEVGQPAPDFSLTGADGKTHSLADYRGQIVVLEWNNPDCPFVKKHYGGNMQKQQAQAVASGVVWLTINSGAPGKQGHLTAESARAYMADTSAKQSAYLFDPDGKTGHAYGARTTPHMFVVDADGKLRYAGGIDSVASADKDDIADATQFVPLALSELAAGKPVSTTRSEPYGCSVKYGG